MDGKISQKLRNGNVLIKTVLILMPLTVLMFAIAIVTNIKALTYIATLCFVISVPSIVVYIELFALIRKSQKYLTRYGLETFVRRAKSEFYGKLQYFLSVKYEKPSKTETFRSTSFSCSFDGKVPCFDTKCTPR